MPIALFALFACDNTSKPPCDAHETADIKTNSGCAAQTPESSARSAATAQINAAHAAGNLRAIVQGTTKQPTIEPSGLLVQN